MPDTAVGTAEPDTGEEEPAADTAAAGKVAGILPGIAAEAADVGTAEPLVDHMRRYTVQRNPLAFHLK